MFLWMIERKEVNDDGISYHDGRVCHRHDLSFDERSFAKK